MTAAPRPPSALPDTDEHTGTRRRILDAATGLFADKGFHGTSVRDIAQAVGVRPASLYEHFPSKDHILATVLGIAFAEVERRVEAGIAAAGDDARHQLAAAVRAIVHVNCSYPQMTITANNELRSLGDEHVQAPRQARDQVSVTLGTILVRGMDAGVFPRRNVVVLVAAIGSMCLRIPYWFAPMGDYTVDDLADEYAELVVAMATSATAEV